MGHEEGKTSTSDLLRYERQVAFEGLGLAGQKALAKARALIVGLGGLGSWAASLLARAGVGSLRLVDPDAVDYSNLHRQGLYDESDADAAAPKVQAAKQHIERINSNVAAEAIAEKLAAHNVEALAAGVDVILDGTDSFPVRFVINDYAVKVNVPWIFAGVVESQAQVMSVVPGRTACLRCIFDSPPPPCVDPTCRSVGVLGPAVAAVASVQAAEAIKILAGKADKVSPFLLKLDLWENSLQRIDTVAAAAKVDCPCCQRKHFEFLES